MFTVEQDAKLRAQAGAELRQKEAAKKAGTGTNYATLMDVRNDFDRRRQAIENNWDLPERAKNLRLAQLKTELRDQFLKTKQSLELKAHAELKSAWQKFNPTPNVANMTPGEVQARQEALEEIAAIVNSIDAQDDATKHARGQAIMDLYAKYHAQDYDIGMDAVVQRAKQYLTPELAKELQQIEDHRKPHIAEARKNWEDLQRSQSNAGTGQALMQDTFMKETALTAPESQALQQAGQQQAQIQYEGTDN